jgi:aspartyl/asparaginyl beta-hydroxylase (cupin superfamily)
MAIEFRLTKKHYVRPDGAYGDHFRYVLTPDVYNWVQAYNIQYDLRWEDEQLAGHTYIFCYLVLQDRLSAILFKLNWL